MVYGHRPLRKMKKQVKQMGEIGIGAAGFALGAEAIRPGYGAPMARATRMMRPIGTTIGVGGLMQMTEGLLTPYKGETITSKRKKRRK
jgi:hypothetical protein